MLNDDRRTIEEAYTSAGNSSDLRVQAERRGDADVLIAAGWTPGILGSAALRLRGEWDRSEKPRPGQNLEQELALLSTKLKSFTAVREAMGAYMGDPRQAQRLIFWWLDQKCQPCGGTRYEVVPGSNRHSAKHCKACRGAGVTHAPYGEQGKKAANFLDDAVQSAKGSIGRRLRALR